MYDRAKLKNWWLSRAHMVNFYKEMVTYVYILFAAHLSTTLCMVTNDTNFLPHAYGFLHIGVWWIHVYKKSDTDKTINTFHITSSYREGTCDLTLVHSY